MATTCTKKKKDTILDIFLEGKITYDVNKPIKLSDIETRLIDALGNPNDKNKLIFLDDNNNRSMTIGRKFKIKVNDNYEREFEIKAYKNNTKTGFNGAVIEGISPEGKKEVILWADGSKGFKHFFTNPQGRIQEAIATL